MKTRFLLVAVLFVFSTISAYSNVLLPLVPSDAYLIVNFDFAAIIAQPEIKALVDTQIETSPNDLVNFYKRAGIEPARDIRNVMLFLDSNERPCVLVNGTFSAKKISELIQTDKELSAGFEIATIDGLQGVKNKLNANGNMIFINETTMAFGAEDALKQVSQLSSGKVKNISNNKAFAHMMERVNTNARLWGAIVTTPNWQSRVEIPVAGLQNMKSAFFSVDYDKEFTMDFTGLVEKKAELPEFADAMINLLAAFRGWTASVPEMTELLKSAKVEDNQENLARIYIAVPAEQFKNSMIKLSEKANKKN
ncbi:MAG: hypothetical protein KKB51_07570 [Candidatus Riflebacteria bacterium]|nr:hypothetical protein [Candidatus Riflebacteria bacterium]